MKNIILLVSFLFLNTVFAKSAPQGHPSIFLYNQTANLVMIGDNSKEVRSIASISKLMTAMVALDYSLDMDKKLSMYDKLRSQLPSKENTRLDVLSAMLIRSDNASAETIASDYPGGREGFLRAMNQKAKDLGMVNTRFMDPSGLSVFNTSTAEEVAIMMKEATKYNMIAKLTTTQEQSFDVKYKNKIKTVTLVNTNKSILSEFRSVVASKTGLTNAAGWCVAMTVENKDQVYTLVILGSKNKKIRLAKVEELMYNNILEKEDRGNHRRRH